MSRSGVRPRPPAPPQRISLLLEIFSVHARMSELVDRELGREGVSARGYAVLSAIGAFGPIRLTELAALLGLPLTTASDIVRRLEGRGHVRRTPNPLDARSKLLELTAAGVAVNRAGWPALQRATRAIRAHLDAPEHEVREALRRLEAAIAAALTSA